jgi:flagellar assembly protein FliH
MSSRILSKALAADVVPLVWSSLGEDPSAEAEESHPPPPKEEVSPDPPPLPAGPTWEAYRLLETKLRQMEEQAPAKEQAIRQAARQEAEAAAAAQWKEALDRLSRALADLASLRHRLRREAEEDVVKLSVAIARRILRRELTLDPDALLGIVKAAVERIQLRETHRVRVRSEDAALVTAFLERIGSPHRIEVLADNALERGGLLFETQRGTMDSSVETQIEEIERGFTDLLGRKGER